MFPVFFSVASKDIALAEDVWGRFPDDWVYIYSKTGEEGAHMWDEISRRELPKSQLFVVFWSKNYLTATGCVREILQAQELIGQGRLRSVVLRLDDTPITWKDDMGEETKPVYSALASMLDYRTSAPHVTSGNAIELIQRVAGPLLKSDHPRLPRHALLQTLRGAVKMDRFKYYPAVWISGFNGVGRETLIKDFKRSFTPNGRGVVIDIDETSLPKQARLRIESEAFGADRKRLRELNALQSDDESKPLADVIERVFSAGDYLIFRHNRVVEENVELPDWLDDVVNTLTPGTRPKLFIISQLPLLVDRRTRCRNSMVAQRVPTIDEHDMTEFCYQLIGFFDNEPGRWSDAEVERIVRASGGTVGFMVSLVRAASTIEDFDQIEQVIASDSGSMSIMITVYVRWAFSQLRDFEDEQRTLLFLDSISPCGIGDIEKVVEPKRPILRVLGKLLELGLIEREGDELFRLTPLLARRLNRDFIRADLLSWLRSALVEFVKKPFELEDDRHEYLRIESRIQAAILTDSNDLPASVVEFVSAAHWFKAGIRLYHARRLLPAYRLLKKAYAKRTEFMNASRSELARYFCLSATRNRKFKEAEDCIKLLDAAQSTKSMAAFLRADVFEHRGEFMSAIDEYQNSIQLNQGMHSRLERTYRPLISCILRTPRPDFALAQKYSIEWLAIRETFFSLMAAARVYLHWKYRGKSYGRDVPADIDNLYRSALARLEHLAGVGSAHFEVKAEEAEFVGNFDDALEYMNKAVAADPRFELRSERWRMMAKSRVPEHASSVLKELEAARNAQENQGNWIPFLPTTAETYAIALKITGQPLGGINTFAPELEGHEIGAIVARAKRF